MRGYARLVVALALLDACGGHAPAGPDGAPDAPLDARADAAPDAAPDAAVATGDPARSMASTLRHACAIASGRLYCWGLNMSGEVGNGRRDYQPVPPTPVSEHTDWTEVVTGRWIGEFDSHAFTCALRGGRRWCWGANGSGQLGDGSTEPSWAPREIDGGWQRLAAGAGHACGIADDGGLKCWGANAHGAVGPGPQTISTPMTIAPGQRFRDVACGDWHTCAVRDDGALLCWGDQSGHVFGGPAAEPTRIGTSSAWVSISAGQVSSCGIQADGSLWCFGVNNLGQLGIGAPSSPVHAPTRVGDGTSWRTVRTTAKHTCALEVDGTLHCWGLNGAGELGVPVNNSTVVSAAPVEVSGRTWSAVTVAGDWNDGCNGCSASHTCGRTIDGEVLCWGASRLGLPDPAPPTHEPVRFGDAADWAEVAPGDWGRRLDGSIHKWHGVGSGPVFVLAHEPVQIGADALPISSHSGAPCYVQADGAAMCGSATCSDSALVCPVAAAPQAGSWRAMDRSWTGTLCGIGVDGALSCWGTNGGALGDGTLADSEVPVAVSGGGSWRHVSTDGGTTCGIQADDSLWCWGQNPAGQVGNGTAGDPELVPVPIGGGVAWQTVVVGGGRACAIDGAGGLWCWGQAGNAGLGDGTTIDRHAPVRIGSATWSRISVHSHICGLRTDGSLWCWGFNYQGQVGVPEPVYVLEPVPVGGDWLDVAVGIQRTCGIRQDRSLWCWGEPTPRGEVPILVALP